MISKEALATIKKMQQSELTESVIYEKIAEFAKGDENKETLKRLSREERLTMKYGNNTQVLR